MTRDEIQKEFDRFFEFDTENRSIVTSTSAKLFAEHVAGLAVAAEREACAKVCEELDGYPWAKALRARGKE